MWSYWVIAAIAISLGVLAGYAIGRWWALILAVLVPPLASLSADDDSNGVPRWFWSLVLIAPPALLGAAIGVAARKRAGTRASRAA